MVFLCVVFKRLWLIVKRPENVKGLCEHIVVKHSIHRWRGWVAFLLVSSHSMLCKLELHTGLIS